MISSQIRVICIMRILEFDKNSRIKSRSETASKELLYGFAKPIKSDVILRLIGKVVPASAAAPSGEISVCLILNSKRSASRVNML